MRKKILSKMSRLHASCFSDDRQRGESIIGVLMAVMLLGIVAYGVAMAMGNVHRSNKALKVSQALNKTQDAIRSSIAKQARLFAGDKCMASASSGGYKQWFDADKLKLFANAQMGFTNKIVVESGSVTSDMSEAAGRCATPVYGAPVKSGEYYRFCLRVSKKSSGKNALASGDSDTFWNKDILELTSTGASAAKNDPFLEVLIIPVNLTTDEPIRCDDYDKSGQNGLKILYSLWWYKKSMDGPAMDSKRRNGVFYVTQK